MPDTRSCQTMPEHTGFADVGWGTRGGMSGGAGGCTSTTGGGSEDGPGSVDDSKSSSGAVSGDESPRDLYWN